MLSISERNGHCIWSASCPNHSRLWSGSCICSRTYRCRQSWLRREWKRGLEHQKWWACSPVLSGSLEGDYGWAGASVQSGARPHCAKQAILWSNPQTSAWVTSASTRKTTYVYARVTKPLRGRSDHHPCPLRTKEGAVWRCYGATKSVQGEGWGGWMGQKNVCSLAQEITISFLFTTDSQRWFVGTTKVPQP